MQSYVSARSRRRAHMKEFESLREETHSKKDNETIIGWKLTDREKFE